MTPEERAAKARQDFEEKTKRILDQELTRSAAEDATYSFEPMEKQWRNLVHEVATDMQLHSQTQTDADDNKFVIVSKARILRTSPCLLLLARALSLHNATSQKPFAFFELSETEMKQKLVRAKNYLPFTCISRPDLPLPAK